MKDSKYIVIAAIVTGIFTLAAIWLQHTLSNGGSVKDIINPINGITQNDDNQKVPSTVINNGNQTWFEQMKKRAEQGEAEAQYELGRLYYNGKGVTQNYSQAVYWYHKAAEQGNVDGQSDFGYMYYKGLGINQDYTQAVYWYRKAAEQGNVDSQYNLGASYHSGRGVNQDFTQAIYWYRKAVAKGDIQAKHYLDVLLSQQ